MTCSCGYTVAHPVVDLNTRTVSNDQVRNIVGGSDLLERATGAITFYAGERGCPIERGSRLHLRVGEPPICLWRLAPVPKYSRLKSTRRSTQKRASATCRGGPFHRKDPLPDGPRMVMAQGRKAA